ncbi:helix-turn-helix domain-containing protein [Phyllobacterium sp. TAF24]|uniref:helix-turn-helix domain-containing protein n=1 Tax=Phyllobacterium sp. TAF24 TaxID=3233068 RepID=UPI003F987B00
MSDGRAWSWRHAIIKSDLQATTRHVLLTISCFMNDMGDGCYPTQEQISEATGLSDRSVRTHLELAEKAGWIKVSEHGFRGQKWRNHQYVASWPDTPDVEKGAEPASGPFVEGAEPPSGKVRNVVPKGAEARSYYQSNNTSNNQSTLDAPARRDGDFNILWDEWPTELRPRSKSAAKATFQRLSKPDQAGAIKFALEFRALQSARKEKALMIPYLKDHLFRGLDGAPASDSDGDFIITPDRAEWSDWLGEMRLRHGEKIVEDIIQRQRIIVKTRWPERQSKAA